MSTILDHLDNLKAGDRVWAECPECSNELPWWIPGNQVLVDADPDYHDDLGLQCDNNNCDFEIMFGPPAILCSQCGNPLKRIDAIVDEPCFYCHLCERFLP